MRIPYHDDRQRKSDKIIAILHDYLQGEEKHLRCLDVGCSSGIISNQLAKRFASVFAVDIQIPLISDNRDNMNSKESAIFAEASGEKLPFPDQSFDVVICAQVYEHVNDQKALASEIYRVIKRGGICFFSGPNRLAIVEEHYWLPFLSWLPHSLASLYMRLFNRGNVYDAYPLFYWQILKILGDFQILDYTVNLLRNPQKYYVNERVEKYSWIQFIPAWVLEALIPFYPNYNWILIKNNGKK